MTLDGFLAKYDGAPMDLEEVACRAEGVVEDKEEALELSLAASGYLEALARFEDALEAVGFEFG